MIFFLISKICALQPGNSQKLMMVQTQVNSQKTELNTVSTVFSFLNDENSRNAFFSISVSYIPALKLCCKTKAVFRNLENPKLLFNCTAPKGFMLQYSLFFSNTGIWCYNFYVVFLGKLQSVCFLFIQNTFCCPF